MHPGPSGSGDPAGLATITPQLQEGPRKDQCKESDSAKKRSDSHSTDRTKRTREGPLGEPEKLQRGGGHTSKPSREVRPLRREESPKRSGGSRRLEENREAEAKKRRTETWAQGQARPRARSQESVVVEAVYVAGARRTHESSSRPRREAFPGHSRSRVRPRTRSRSEDRRRSSKSHKKTEIRRR